MQRIRHAFARQRGDTKSSGKIREPTQHPDLEPVVVMLEPGVEGIPQDVLRVALHQRTALHVVGFHQQPAHMGPEEARDRAVRILLVIRKMMVPAVDRRPMRGGILQGAYGDDRECVLEPRRAGEASVRDQPMVTEIDADRAEDVAVPTTSRTTPVQLKNQGKTASAASAWQTTNAPASPSFASSNCPRPRNDPRR